MFKKIFLLLSYSLNIIIAVLPGSEMATNKSLFMNGFKEDCEQLITRFERADNIRFETFCDIWKAMKFSLVFA